MLGEALKKFEFSYNYFTKSLEAGKIPQSIIFEGLDIYGQLFFALELSRVLNCQKNGEWDCDCINCKWIKEGTHPAVMLISPIDSKNNDTGSKTVISTKQSLGIIKALEQTSDYHRVFILLNAEKKTPNEIEKKSIEQYESLNIKLQEDWVPSAINHKIFQHSATNAILKAVEEPPKNTTFIFLTHNREDVIQTIVSRSMVFPIPSERKITPVDEIKDIFYNYPNLTLEDALDISSQLQAKEQEIDVILSMIEEFIMQNGRNKKHLKEVLKARKYHYATIADKTIYDALMLGLVNE